MKPAGFFVENPTLDLPPLRSTYSVKCNNIRNNKVNNNNNNNNNDHTHDTLNEQQTTTQNESCHSVIQHVPSKL
jgi:hypothetical protein